MSENILPDELPSETLERESRFNNDNQVNSFFPEYHRTNEFWARLYLSQATEPKEWWGNEYLEPGTTFFPGTKDHPCIFTGKLPPTLHEIHVLEPLLAKARKSYIQYKPFESSVEDELAFQVAVEAAKAYVRVRFKEDFPDVNPEETTVVSDTYVMLGRALAFGKLSDEEIVKACKYYLSILALGKISQFVVCASKAKGSWGIMAAVNRPMNPRWYSDWAVKTTREYPSLLQRPDQKLEVYSAELPYWKDVPSGWEAFISLLEAQEALATLERISSREDIKRLEKDKKEESRKSIREAGRQGGLRKNEEYRNMEKRAVKLYQSGQFGTVKDAAAKEISKIICGVTSETIRKWLRNIHVADNSVSPGV